MKYKLHTKFPFSPKLGFVADFSNSKTISVKSLPDLKEEHCKEYPEHWSPYLFTTNDGFDVYPLKEDVWNEEGVLYVFQSTSETPLLYKTVNGFPNKSSIFFITASFKSKEKAEEHQKYLLEKEFKFKVGDIVVYTHQTGKVIGKVVKTERKRDYQAATYVVLNHSNNKTLTINIEWLELASLEEQLEYYQQAQFVEGSIMFVDNIGEVTVENVVLEANQIRLKGVYQNELIELDPKFCTYLRSKEEQERLLTVNTQVNLLIDNLCMCYPNIPVKDILLEIINVTETILNKNKTS